MQLLTIALVGLCAAATLVAAAPRDELQQQWAAYKDRHQKVYADEQEDRHRFSVWLTNKVMVEEHNKLHEQGERSFTLNENHLSDMTEEELVFMNGFRPSLKRADLIADQTKQNPEVVALKSLITDPSDDLPASVDWRTSNCVSRVKNQKRCGSCWAFSATGALESSECLKTGKIVELSEQNLVDCAQDFGTFGCGGGSPDAAFTYINYNKGIDAETSYPYEGKDDTCRFKRQNVVATDKGLVDVPHFDEKALMKAVAKTGPISIAINAGMPSFRLYNEGVYDEPNCSGKLEDLDHAVLLVGYGTDAKHGDYWIVKNSWSEQWGEKGYIRMARNKNNQCGIATYASFPIL